MPTEEGPQSIQIGIDKRSLANLWIFPVKKFIFGSPLKISVKIKNLGNIPFPEKDIIFKIKIRWSTGDIVQLKANIEASSILPNEIKGVINEDITYCLSQGYAFISFSIYCSGSKPIKIFSISNNEIEVSWSGSSSTENGVTREFWSDVHSTYSIDSFYVTTKQEIYTLIALLTSIFASTLAVIGLFFR